ncbi:MAG: class I SAM-dependent methyltransferase, partial [Saprospiraceae bacterium]
MSHSLMDKPAGYFSNVREEMATFLPEKIGVVLEIGCGEGGYAAHLKNKYHCEVWGIEYEETQGSHAAKLLDKVLIGDAHVLIDQLPDNYFDTVICNDVLEHLYDPYTILSKLKMKMKPEGKVISSIPNIRYFRTFFALLFKKQWDYQANGILDITHVRFFTTKSIVKMYENAEYQV